jgi:tetratricopeptide (TPR) repeat protein
MLTTMQPRPFRRRILPLAAALMIGLPVFSQAADSPALPADYPQSLERDLKAAREALQQTPSDPKLLVKLASIYLDLGEDLYTEKAQKLDAFEEGARQAKAALDVQENNAEAHYLYAANLGSASEVKGMAASLLALDEIKKHAKRALELQKDYVPALHMAGMMLEELPQFMGGNKTVALDYVKRAVALAPNYSHARLDLAKMYLQRKDQEAAKRELIAVIKMEQPSDPYPWTRKYRPEAEKLLNSLENSK